MPQDISMVGEILKDLRGIKYILKNIFKIYEIPKNIIDISFDKYER